MVNGLNSALSAAKRYGEYGANFLLGTGSETMGKTIASTIKGRKTAGISLPKAIGRGFKDGFVKSNAEMKAAGGYFQNLRKTLGAIPAQMSEGWAQGTGKNVFTKFFSKLGKSIKPLGKAMPFAMNALWLASYLPDIVNRTKDEGIVGGLKETGKALTNMAAISVAISTGMGLVGGPLGFVAGMGLSMAASFITSKILGKSYGEKKAEEEAQKQAQAQQNPFANPEAEIGKNIDYMAG